MAASERSLADFDDVLDVLADRGGALGAVEAADVDDEDVREHLADLGYIE